MAHVIALTEMQEMYSFAANLIRLKIDIFHTLAYFSADFTTDNDSN